MAGYSLSSRVKYRAGLVGISLKMDRSQAEAHNDAAVHLACLSLAALARWPPDMVAEIGHREALPLPPCSLFCFSSLQGTMHLLSPPTTLIPNHSICSSRLWTAHCSMTILNIYWSISSRRQCYLGYQIVR